MVTRVSYFYVYKDHASEWRWKFLAANGNIIADSAEGYKKLTDCEHGIALIQGEAPRSVTVGDATYTQLRP